MDHSLWAITSYFNPAGYTRRLDNYHTFRRQLKVPLVTVEYSRRGEFVLGSEDAEILIQLRGRDVMWQKERLLNLALSAVPSSCKKVAWLDCDIVYSNSAWVSQTLRALDEFPVVQPYASAHLLASCEGHGASVRCVESVWPSVAYRVEQAAGNAAPYRGGRDWRMGAKPGLAWAARREVLRNHGFYDAFIVGGGDALLAAAAYGYQEGETCRMNVRQRAHYLAWAEPFFDTVQGRVGHIGATIYHLWHGKADDRHYSERNVRLRDYGFDPFSDIALDENQCWRWNTDKKDLHRFVRDYFASRKEDG